MPISLKVILISRTTLKQQQRDKNIMFFLQFCGRVNSRQYFNLDCSRLDCSHLDCSDYLCLFWKGNSHRSTIKLNKHRLDGPQLLKKKWKWNCANFIQISPSQSWKNNFCFHFWHIYQIFFKIENIFLPKLVSYRGEYFFWFLCQNFSKTAKKILKIIFFLYF